MDLFSTKDKVNYVKAQPGDGQHTCHWPGCGKIVPPAMWGCKKHWLKLPYHLRRRIWATYRPGQEIDKNPSADYMTTSLAIQVWIRESGAEV